MLVPVPAVVSGIIFFPVTKTFLTHEFRRFELDLLEVSETHIPGVGSKN